MSNDHPEDESLPTGHPGVARVADDDLEFGEGDQMTLDGKPFTGVSFHTYPGGQLREELSFVDGLLQGPCREWHENGQLSREWTSEPRGTPERRTSWHPNGALASVTLHDFGIELECSEWDEHGVLQLHRVLDPDSTKYDVLLQLRARHARESTGRSAG